MTELTDADERFHPPPTDDPFWTETAWFAFSVPERNLAGALYPLFRPNQGVCSTAVYVWDDTSENPWDARYGRTQWHVPLPAQADLTDLQLPSGLSYTCTKPMQRWELRYRDGDTVAIELEFAALMDPHPVGVSTDRGHFDQPGRIIGTVTIDGEAIDVDCLDMRDRSWSVRADTGSVRAGYCYGTSEGTAFQAMSFLAGDTEMVIAGYLLRDGERAAITSGTRAVERDGIRPKHVRLEATDALGRTVEATGTYLNRLAFQSSPNLFAWMSLTRWDVDGGEMFGEDQDIWSPDQLRAAR